VKNNYYINIKAVCTNAAYLQKTPFVTVLWQFDKERLDLSAFRSNSFYPIIWLIMSRK